MADLLTDIELFLRTHSMKPTRFGQDATGDRHLVFQLRAGRRCWPETEAKVRAFMVSYRPEVKAA